VGVQVFLSHVFHFFLLINCFFTWLFLWLLIISFYRSPFSLINSRKKVLFGILQHFLSSWNVLPTSTEPFFSLNAVPNRLRNLSAQLLWN
jgi:TM2 domain-containing membrane protein YozV